MRYLTIALSKGRLTDLSIELLEEAGIDCSELKKNTRKLILTDEKNRIRFFLAKPSDVPTYVEYGAADIGIVGRDTLLEEGRNLYEVLDLGFSACKMCVAGPKELDGNMDNLTITRVATKYPEIAKDLHNCGHFSQSPHRGIQQRGYLIFWILYIYKVLASHINDPQVF